MRDPPDCFQTLSWKIYQILEDIDANDGMFKQSLNISTFFECFAVPYESMSYFIFGSFYEGTTLPGLESDIDCAVIVKNLPVVTASSNCPAGKCLLLVQDETTHPGYCKLQVVENGRLIWGNNAVVTDPLITKLFNFYPDKNNRLVCKLNHFGDLSDQRYIKHGPAFTAFTDRIDFDFVIGLMCENWPACASEWLTRKRHFSWPSTEMINLCSTLGCLFVPIGHPDSDEQNKLWRVSLSHQERLIVRSFNSVQRKCYILLKIIKKELIAPYIPDSLSSYHLKTCMFYLVENTSPDIWRSENLLQCVVASLRLLSRWAEIGLCPNYFIPEENMFDRHVRGNVRQQLHQRLQYLISSDCQFLVHIQTDRIGLHLQNRCAPSTTTAVGACHSMQKNPYLEGQIFKLFSIFKVKDFCFNEHRPCVDDATLLLLYKYMNGVRKRSRFTTVQSQRTVSIALAYVELSFMSSLISLAVQKGTPMEQIWRYLTSEKWHTLSLQSDPFSSKIKQATFLYMQGHYYPSLDILSTLSGLDRVSICECYLYSDVSLSNVEQSNITTEDLLKNRIVPCLYFLPMEKDVIPTALCYEMIRTEGQNAPSTVTNNGGLDGPKFRDCAFVDSRFLLHFLLYLNHTHLNMDPHATADISNMEWMLNTQKVSHRETCLNLLGWTYKTQGHVNRAMECFRKSIEVKSYYNAAFWHIRDIQDIINHSSIGPK